MTVGELMTRLDYLLSGNLIRKDDHIMIGSVGGNGKSTFDVDVAYPKVIPDISHMDENARSLICFVSATDIEGFDSLAFLKGEKDG